MEGINTLTDEQIKDIQTLLAQMLAPSAGDKKISALDAMPAIADADLFAMVDDTDSTTKKGTALQVKNFITLLERELISGSDYRLNPQESLSDRFNTSTAYQIGKVDILSAPGTRNTCVGENSNGSLTTGEHNLFAGYNAGGSTTSGSYNNYLGYEAGKAGTTAQFNTAFGYKALTAITNASNNTVMGNQCGAAITSGGYNTLIGTSTGVQTTTASSTIGIGRDAARINNADYLLAIGHRAGRANLIGTADIYIGKDAGLLATGNNNTFVGYESGDAVTTGGNNTLYGCQTGGALTTETGNVHLGYQAGSQSTASNKLFIDNSNTTTPLIGGDFSANTLSFRGIASYYAHPTFNADTQLIDKKYVDDLITSVATPATYLAAETITGSERNLPVAGNGGAVTLTSNPQITAGNNGDRKTLIGTNDADTLTVIDGNGLALDNGQNFTLGQNDIIEFVFYNSLWIETSRVDN